MTSVEGGLQTGRAAEVGWELLARPDGRRGLWMRQNADVLELCAGREGDDAYVLIRNPPPGLVSCMLYLAYSSELAEVPEPIRQAGTELPSEPSNPCANCGKQRTKAEGGTMFTVCGACYGRSQHLIMSVDAERYMPAAADALAWAAASGMRTAGSQADVARAMALLDAWHRRAPIDHAARLTEAAALLRETTALLDDDESAELAPRIHVFLDALALAERGGS